MGLIQRLSDALRPVPDEERAFWPYATLANGQVVPITLQQTLQGTVEETPSDFAGWANVYRTNGIVAAVMAARSGLFSEASFMFRERRKGRPGNLYSTPALELLRTPWPNGTTQDLLAHAIQDVDLSGNAFFVRRPDRIVRLRPDWVDIRLSGDARSVDAEVIGYVYHPGGRHFGQPVPFLVEEVAHFTPTPDPVGRFLGVSWLPSVLAEVLADNATTAHLLAFFRQGATPNMVVSLDPALGKQAFEDWRASFKASQEGVANAYKTLVLGGGAKVEVVGANLQQLEFKGTRGAGEVRIANAAGVPATVLGLSEGLAGSSLNAGNFAQSMRRFADLTMRPLWRGICGSLAAIIDVPPGSELWYDDADIPALRDDVMDVAEVMAKNAQAMRQLIDAGFEPDSVVDAITSGDYSRLTHSGYYSVQLQELGAEPEPEPVPAALAPFVKPVAEAEPAEEGE